MGQQDRPSQIAQPLPIKYMVTGANGFVGRSLCKNLEKNGMNVVAAVRHLVVAAETSNYYVQIGQIDGETDWQSALKGCSVVVHLAARVHVMNDITSDPLAEFLRVNLHGTLNLARQAATAGARRFVYVSSIKVNGEFTDGKPFTELDEANPQDPYAVSKWQAEIGLHEIGRETGMEIVVVRPPLVYGPGVKANFYRLLKLVSLSIPLPFGSFNNRRSMIYVENLVDALVLCSRHPKAAGQTYLVADHQSFSTQNIIKNIAYAMQKRSWIIPFPIFLMRLGAKLIGRESVVDRLTQSLEIDNKKIISSLGWQPPYTAQQGIEATVEWFLESEKTCKVEND